MTFHSAFLANSSLFLFPARSWYHSFVPQTVWYAKDMITSLDLMNTKPHVFNAFFLGNVTMYDRNTI